MPWDAIGLVGSGLTLVAFIASIGAWSYQNHLKHTEALIKSAPDKDRPRIMEGFWATVRVDTSSLTENQKYHLAVKLLGERATRFRTSALVVMGIAVLAAIVALVALVHGGSGPVPVVSPTPAASPMRHSAERTVIITEVKEAYLDVGRKLAFFYDWGRPPAIQTFRVSQGLLTATAPDGRNVSIPVDPTLLPVPTHYNASLAQRSPLPPAEAAAVAQFFSSYAQFRGALVGLASAPQNVIASFISARSFAEETVVRGHSALCSMGVAPPRMFPNGGFSEPIPPDCETRPFP